MFQKWHINGIKLIQLERKCSQNCELENGYNLYVLKKAPFTDQLKFLLAFGSFSRVKVVIFLVTLVEVVGFPHVDQY